MFSVIFFQYKNRKTPFFFKKGAIPLLFDVDQAIAMSIGTSGAA